MLALPKPSRHLTDAAPRTAPKASSTRPNALKIAAAPAAGRQRSAIEAQPPPGPAGSDVARRHRRSPLQPLIDEALMGGVLIDEDERILRLGDDEGVVHLGTRSAERIGGLIALIRARMGDSARRGDRRKRRLGPLGEAEGARRRLMRREAMGWPRHAGNRLLGQACRGTVLGAAKGLMQCGDDQRANGLRIAEPELGLGRMHIHVDLVGRQREEERKHGMPPVRHEVAIAAAHGAGQSLSRTGLPLTTRRYCPRLFGRWRVASPAKPSTAIDPRAARTGNASVTKSSPRMRPRRGRPWSSRPGGQGSRRRVVRSPVVRLKAISGLASASRFTISANAAGSLRARTS